MAHRQNNTAFTLKAKVRGAASSEAAAKAVDQLVIGAPVKVAPPFDDDPAELSVRDGWHIVSRKHGSMFGVTDFDAVLIHGARIVDFGTIPVKAAADNHPEWWSRMVAFAEDPGCDGSVAMAIREHLDAWREHDLAVAMEDAQHEIGAMTGKPVEREIGAMLALLSLPADSAKERIARAKYLSLLGELVEWGGDDGSHEALLKGWLAAADAEAPAVDSDQAAHIGDRDRPWWLTVNSYVDDLLGNSPEVSSPMLDLVLRHFKALTDLNQNRIAEVDRGVSDREEEALQDLLRHPGHEARDRLARGKYLKLVGNRHDWNNSDGVTKAIIDGWTAEQTIDGYMHFARLAAEDLRDHAADYPDGTSLIVTAKGVTTSWSQNIEAVPTPIATAPASGLTAAKPDPSRTSSAGYNLDDLQSDIYHMHQLMETIASISIEADADQAQRLNSLIWIGRDLVEQMDDKVSEHYTEIATTRAKAA